MGCRAWRRWIRTTDPHGCASLPSARSAQAASDRTGPIGARPCRMDARCWSQLPAGQPSCPVTGGPATLRGHVGPRTLHPLLPAHALPRQLAPGHRPQRQHHVARGHRGRPGGPRHLGHHARAAPHRRQEPGGRPLLLGQGAAAHLCGPALPLAGGATGHRAARRARHAYRWPAADGRLPLRQHPVRAAGAACVEGPARARSPPAPERGAACCPALLRLLPLRVQRQLLQPPARGALRRAGRARVAAGQAAAGGPLGRCCLPQRIGDGAAGAGLGAATAGAAAVEAGLSPSPWACARRCCSPH